MSDGKPECTLDEVFRLLRHFDEKLTEHMRDEEGKYKSLERKIDRLAEAVESLAVLHRAFPLTDDGTAPDLEDHHDFHVEQRKGYRAAKSRKERIKEQLIDKAVNFGVLAIGVIVVLGLHQWIMNWLGIAK